jgi:AraC-like DNA-binding protein
MFISRHGVEQPPSSTAPTVSSEYLKLFAAGAEARGLDVESTFAASGIDPAVLRRRGARVASSVVGEAWKLAVDRLGDPHFGLTLVDTLPFGTAALMDYIVLSSADAGDGLSRVVRYAPLMSTSEPLTLTMRGNEARMRLHGANTTPYAMELLMALFARRSRDLFGPYWSLKRVCFTHAPLGPRAAYDRICQAPVYFGRPFNEGVFARDLLDLPMAGADANVNAMLVDQAEAALATLGPSAPGPSFIDTVKRVLSDGLYERDFTLTRLADQLSVSTRTLQRRLRAAGVSHRGLVREVREDLATRSLAARVSQGKIARTLRYSGAGAFHRAFKRWSGMTPGQVSRAPARPR